MLKIRENAFETNSSSCHSLVINDNTDYDTITSGHFFAIDVGEFGWGYEELRYTQDKAIYVATLLTELFKYYLDKNERWELITWAKANYWQCWENFSEVIKEQTGAQYVQIKLKEASIGDYFSFDGYIDHQSCVYIYQFDFLLDKKKIKDLIFGRKSYIIITNDNM
jgi:hypothetical protein